MTENEDENKWQRKRRDNKDIGKNMLDGKEKK